MDQEAFNLSIRKFLKTVGVSSQREIEQALAQALANATIGGTEILVATMTLRVEALGLERTFEGQIEVK
jgi:hypothetical protein